MNWTLGSPLYYTIHFFRQNLLRTFGLPFINVQAFSTFSVFKNQREFLICNLQ